MVLSGIWRGFGGGGCCCGRARTPTAPQSSKNDDFVVSRLRRSGTDRPTDALGVLAAGGSLRLGCVAELGGTARGRDDECRRSRLCARGRSGHVGGQGGGRVSRRPLRALDRDGGQRGRIAVTLLFCRPEQATLWLALLFVAQLATGPVLSLMYDKSGRASGTAFGLNCLALFTGSL